MAHANAERATSRGYLLFATDPNIPPEESSYREVRHRREGAKQAMATVTPITDGRRLRAYLATGRYRDELADARRAVSGERARPVRRDDAVAVDVAVADDG